MMKIKPQTKNITIASKTSVTIKTVATTISLGIARGVTCQSVSVREMKAGSESNTYQDDNDHENPGGSEITRK